MCGIVGVIGPGATEQDLSVSLAALALRGPDRQAQISSGIATLGHTRLSIIDTSSGGDQPMQDHSGRYTLVFNGEIYNYRTIAETLRAKGHTVIGNSDTEVLLKLLISEGKGALTQLNGFFALAFYDRDSDYCLLARDRMGIKPLYYCHNEEQLSFASEMKGLLPLIKKKKVDSTALHFYLRLNYIPAPLSAQIGVASLKPGSCLEFRAGELARSSYYEVKNSANKPSQEHQGEKLRELLVDAVKMRLQADVPLGSFLSGGVDSSIIAALAAREVDDLQTFSIGFSDYAHFDESGYAEQVAKHIGSSHTTIQLCDDEMLSHVEHVLAYADEPFADSSAIAVHALSAHTRKQLTVALSGDGADELFGGYNKHQAHLMACQPGLKGNVASLLSKLLKGERGSHTNPIQNQIRRLNRFAAGQNLSPTKRYWTWASWTEERKVSELLSIPRVEHDYQAILAEYGPVDERLEEVLLADTRLVLADDMLRKVDRMSMANSLEVRVPFLDHRVVEYAHGLKAAARFGKGKGKFILQESFGDLLPSNIFERKKKGFEVPLEAWFNGPLHSQLMAVLSDGLLLNTGWFNRAELSALSGRVKHKQIGSEVHLLWALMVLHSYISRWYND